MRSPTRRAAALQQRTPPGLEVPGRRGLEPALADAHPDQSLGAGPLRLLDEVVEVLAGEARAGDGDGLDGAAPGDHLGEHLEGPLAEEVGAVGQLEPEPHVRLVRAVAAHRVVPGEPGKGAGQLDALRPPEDLDDEALHDGQEVVAVEERRLDVDLAELRLAVGAQVLVPEAADDLEVALEPAHHQDLLEELWGLGQGVEAPAGQTARDEEVPGALRGRAREHRRLDLDEALAVEVVPHGAADLVAQQDVPQHRRPPHIEIAVAEAQRLDGLLALVEGKRQGPGLVEHAQLVDLDLDLPGRQPRVLGPGRPTLHDAPGGQHEFRPDAPGDFVGAGVRRRVEDELGEPLAVPEVHEDQPPMVAPAERPAHQRDGPARVSRPEGAAGMRPPPAAQRAHRSTPGNQWISEPLAAPKRR